MELLEENTPTNSTSVNTILELFDQTIGNNRRFVMAQTGRLLDWNLFTVHLRDMSQKTLLIIKILPGPPQRKGSSRICNVEREHIIQVTITSGEILFTATTFSAGVMAVWCGAADGHHLGKLKFSSHCCSADLWARRANGELLFHMGSGSGGLCGRSPTEFSLIANKDTLARIQRTNDKSTDVEVSLLNTQYFDTLTKAFVIFAGYGLYISYFAETSKGRSGVLGEAKCGQCCCIILTVLVIMVPIVVLFIEVFK